MPTTTAPSDGSKAKRGCQPRFSLHALRHDNISELARTTGYPLRTLLRWKTTGIPLHSADRLAIRLGVHPANIWHDWYAAGTSDS